MTKRLRYVLLLEVLWWLLTAVITWAVLWPIHKAIHVWPFERWNIIFIVTLITLTRYIFLLPHTLIAKAQEVKVGLLLLMFPLTFVLVEAVNSFMVYIEENTWDALTGHLPLEYKHAIENYIWSEMLFFGVGSFIAAPLFAIRLLISVWRTRNLGTV
ncbi:MAG: hypothetical protein NZM43_03045 [Saprospiraceae bacterium]|nr:hypothetical protein [Saprospiraceae bacterium]MDW8483280.1 hypothetical protein [Saprospiraceae bacterium]